MSEYPPSADPSAIDLSHALAAADGGQWGAIVLPAVDDQPTWIYIKARFAQSAAWVAAMYLDGYRFECVGDPADLESYHIRKDEGRDDRAGFMAALKART